MGSSLTICAIQLPTLGMQTNKLDIYIQNAYKKGVKIILFGEYVLNHFFKELNDIPVNMIKEQTQKHIKLFQKYAKEYNITLIAPVIIVKDKKYFKKIVKVTSKSINYYMQQILIPYEHWNEKSFFSNPISGLKPPLIFKERDFKIMVIGGFELHFDYFWQIVTDRKVDLVLIPTASTFNSHNRWREIIKTEAFLHNCYILRANRLGEYTKDKIKWKFYGDSMIVNPNGEVDMMLEDRESMLIETIDRNLIEEHRKNWGFAQEVAIRKKLS